MPARRSETGAVRSAVIRIHAPLLIAAFSASASLVVWQAPPPRPGPTQTPPVQPGPMPTRNQPDVRAPSGQMRIEPRMIRDIRVGYLADNPENAQRSLLEVRGDLAGAELFQVVRLGRFIIERAADNAGNELPPWETLTDAQRNETRPVVINAQRAPQGVVPLTGVIGAPSRSAESLAYVEASIRVGFASRTEEILIDNPLDRIGEALTHPRLDELGIKPRLVSPADVPAVQDEIRGFGLTFDDGEERFVRVRFFDAWFRELRPQTRLTQGTREERVYFFNFVSGAFDADLQMEINVYSDLELRRLRMRAEDVPLP